MIFPWIFKYFINKIYFPFLISSHIERWGNEKGEINFKKIIVD